MPTTSKDDADPYVYTGGGTAMRKSQWDAMTKQQQEDHLREANKKMGFTNFPPPDRVTPDHVVEEK